jgi:hypothetical protein
LEAENVLPQVGISKGNEKQWLIYCHLSKPRRKPATKEGMENPYDREGDRYWENIVMLSL